MRELFGTLPSSRPCPRRGLRPAGQRRGLRRPGRRPFVGGCLYPRMRGTSSPERVIRTLAAPAYFGEIGLLEGIPRTATVTSLGGCRCEAIDGERFLAALSASSASGSLLAGIRKGLAVTHPSLRTLYGEAEAMPEPAGG